MSAHLLDPVPPEPGYQLRWARQSLLLILGSPFLFAAYLALLTAPYLATNSGADELVFLISFFGAPALLLLGQLVAKASDTGFSSAFSATKLKAALSASKPVFAIWSVFGVLVMSATYLLIHTSLIDTSTTSANPGLNAAASTGNLMVVLAFGYALFTAPLIALSGVPFMHALQLSKKACDFFFALPFLLAYVPSALSFAKPSFFFSAVGLICANAYLYVAYREMFEQRSQNSPKTVSAPAPIPSTS